MNFSVVVIARNEVRTLPRLAGSLLGFQKQGGEIIVVDTGSTDGTAEVAKKLGCTVFEEGDRFRVKIDGKLAKKINDRFLIADDPDILKGGESLFDYSSARNYAASLAKNNMVAMPDCDEIYTRLSLDTIQEHIASGVEQLEYNFVFAHGPNGEETIKFLHSKFYNRKKAKWVGIIHEILSGDVRRQWVGEDVIKLEHWQNHGTDRSGYLLGLALDCHKNPENDRNSHYFAREMMYTGRYKSAIQEFERHISMQRWPAERSQSMIFIGECLIKLGKEEKAIEWWNRAFSIESGRNEPFIRLSDHYARKGDAVRAAVYAKAAMELNYTGFYADNMSNYYAIPEDICKWAYKHLGKEYAPSKISR